MTPVSTATQNRARASLALEALHGSNSTRTSRRGFGSGLPRRAPFRRQRAALAPSASRVVFASSSQANPYDVLEGIECDLSTVSAPFYNVTAIIRPWRLPAVVAALSEAGIRGVTVTDVRGIGAQGGNAVNERDGGNEVILGALIEKAKVEIVIARDQVDFTVRLLSTTCYTGQTGDGKIWVSPVADVIRVRTGETGAVAERMQDGLYDKGYKSEV